MIIFLDIETTGLDPKYDSILEVAAYAWSGCTIRPEDGCRFEAVIQLQPGDYQKANDFVQNMHESSGLWRDCAASHWSLAQVAVRLERWLQGLQKECPNEFLTLAGNSIHFDRSFLKAQMPYVERMFHYRMLDVSSLHIAADRLGQPRAPKPEQVSHRAMADVLDSIRQLEFYRRAA